MFPVQADPPGTQTEVAVNSNQAPSTKPQQTLSERIARLDVTVVTPIGKVVLLTAAAFADRYTGDNLWTSATRLAELTGLSRSAVHVAIRHLTRIGVLMPCTGERPEGVDPRVPGRRIVVDHIPGTPRKTRPIVENNRVTRRHSPPPPTVSPGGHGLCHQVDTTVPVPSQEVRGRGEGRTPPPPASQPREKPKGTKTRERLRLSLAGSGYATADLDEWEAWLRFEGFQTWSDIEDFLAWGQQAHRRRKGRPARYRREVIDLAREWLDAVGSQEAVAC